jgi:hypothetical protein
MRVRASTWLQQPRALLVAERAADGLLKVVAVRRFCPRPVNGRIPPRRLADRGGVVARTCALAQPRHGVERGGRGTAAIRDAATRRALRGGAAAAACRSRSSRRAGGELAFRGAWPPDEPAGGASASIDVGGGSSSS